MDAQLKTVGEVFSETWEVYKERAIPILLVALISICLVFLTAFCTSLAVFYFQGGVQAFIAALQAGHFSLAAMAAAAVGVTVFIILIVWSQTATLAISVDESMTVSEALAAGWKYFFSIGWAGTLYFSIVTTGLMLFVLPGVFFGLSMSLWFYALLDDDLRGMDAVLASHLYMRGRWWNTFFKFILVLLMSLALGSVPVIGQLLSFVFTPFFLIYMLVVYRDLEESSEAVVYQVKRRWPWFLMVAAGIILPLFALLGAAVTLGPQVPQVLEDIREGRVPGIELPSFGSFDLSVSKPVKNPPPLVTRLPSVEGFWIWHDPTGDTKNHFLDISEVAVRGEQNELQFQVRMASSFKAYFSAAKSVGSVPLVSLYLDTDVDRRTGGKVIAESERSGYDFVVDVLLDTKKKAGEGRARIALFRLNGDQRQPLGSLDAQNVTVFGNTLSLRIPGALLGIHSEDMLRMCFLEFGQRQGSGLAKDKLIPLK